MVGFMRVMTFTFAALEQAHIDISFPRHDGLKRVF
jgi:hypothetical protein